MGKWFKFIIGFVIVALIFFFFVLPPVVDKLYNRVTKRQPVKPSELANALHSSLWIADLHCDALLWKRNLLNRNSRGHADIPRLIEGKIALQGFTIVSKTPFGLNFEANDANSDMITLLAIAQLWPTRTWFSLKERALYQSEKLHRFAKESKRKFSIIKSKSDLAEYITRRKKNTQMTAGFLGIEGAQVLEGKLENLRELFTAGFRMMAPTHFFDTEVGGSAHGIVKGGLTEFGKQVIPKMEQLGMLIDLAHASPKTIDDVLAIATRPVVSSHTGVKGTCDNNRNISDKHVKGIAATGGVVGIAFFPMATCGKGLQPIIGAIKYVANLAGVEHVALGSDFDGSVETPFDVTGLVELTDGLLKAGFSEEEVKLIMGENVQRVLLQTLPD